MSPYVRIPLAARGYQKVWRFSPKVPILHSNLAFFLLACSARFGSRVSARMPLFAIFLFPDAEFPKEKSRFIIVCCTSRSPPLGPTRAFDRISQYRRCTRRDEMKCVVLSIVSDILLVVRCLPSPQPQRHALSSPATLDRSTRDSPMAKSPPAIFSTHGSRPHNTQYRFGPNKRD